MRCLIFSTLMKQKLTGNLYLGLTAVLLII